MAHNKCIGTWEKSQLDGVDDGRIRIDNHTGNTFEGRHLKTGASLEATFCDGTNISFSRMDTANSQRVSYKGEIVQDGPKYRIRNGRYDKTSVGTDQPELSYGSDDQPDAGGDWESEKPT